MPSPPALQLPQSAAPITHGPRTRPLVALSFDADMTPGMQAELKSGRVKSFNNLAVLHFLEKNRIPATFFLTGAWAQVYPETAREIAANPLFEIGNHSQDHLAFQTPCYGLPTAAESQQAAQITEAQKNIAAITGKTPRYFRFPGGCAGPRQWALVRSLGLQTVHWDVVGGDAGQKDPAVIVRTVLGGVKNGSIVVLHSSGGHAPATALALPAIVKGLRARGFQFVTVGALLAGGR